MQEDINDVVVEKVLVRTVRRKLGHLLRVNAIDVSVVLTDAHVLGLAHVATKLTLDLG